MVLFSCAPFMWVVAALGALGSLCGTAATGPASRPAGWPPTAAQVIAARPPPMESVSIKVGTGENPTLDLKFDSKLSQGWHFQLLSVYYFHGQEFLGIFQQFIDEDELGVGSTQPLPPTPDKTDTVVAELRTYLYFEHDPPHHVDLSDKRYLDWYAATAKRFATTGTIDRQPGWEWQIWKSAPDLDMPAWMTASKISFKVGIASSEVIHVEPH